MMNAEALIRALRSWPGGWSRPTGDEILMIEAVYNEITIHIPEYPEDSVWGVAAACVARCRFDLTAAAGHPVTAGRVDAT